MLLMEMVPVLAAFDPSKLVDAVRLFIGPLLLFGIGVVAIKFLVQRQMTQFFQFMAIAVLILLLFYTPGVLTAIVEAIAGIFSDSGATVDTNGIENAG